MNTALPDPTTKPFSATSALKIARYFKQVLNSLECPKYAVRLLLLPPGGKIRTHVDTFTDFRIGRVRLQIPIVNTDEMMLTVGSDQFSWTPGELWHANVSMPHSVRNLSKSMTRANIVADVGVTPALLELLPQTFVKEIQKYGIAMTEPVKKVSLHNLARRQCSIQFSPDFVTKFPLIHMNRNYGKLSFRAEIRVNSKRLWLLTDGTARYELLYAGGDDFTLGGMPPGIRLRLIEKNGKVTSASVHIRMLPRKRDGTPLPVDIDQKLLLL